MPSQTPTPESFQTFGDLLRFLRRRERLTQLELSIAVGYSEAQIGRLENNQRRPDLTALKALFIPALHLEDEPELCARLLELAAANAVLPETPESTLTTQTNLPAALTRFIGRDKEQEEVANHLGKHRLVTLAGVGGIGKTRLALQVGQRLLKDYPDGVWLVGFDSLSDPALVPQTVATIFGIRAGADRPITEILINYLRGKAILLIFDNCEHLLDACAHLTTSLLTSCPKLKILATSRETLNVAGEATYSLPSLSIPDSEMSLEKLTEFESLRLFTERASLSSPSFTLTNQNAQTVLDICRRVDGLPLAIEFAAARVNILQVEEILKQLHTSFALLAGDNRTTLPRQQTIRTSMDWSWGLLSEAEQIYLRQLSVFAGGWTLESAQAVCDGDVIGLKSALVKKSLIVVKQETGRETRYRFHEIVRQYAREKLVESGEEEIRDRHLKYFLQLSEEAEPALKGPLQMEWYACVNSESDNIRTALEWADKTNVEAGLYISGRLERFWEDFDMRGGIRWLERFLKKTESRNHLPAKACALHTYAILLRGLQQFAEARTAAQECLEIQHARGDLSREMDILLVLGDILIFSGKIETGMDLIQQAYVLSQSVDDTWRKANMLYFLGYYHRENPFYWEEAIVLFRQVGDWGFLINILSWQASDCILNGDVELAQKHIDEAEALREFNAMTNPWINSETTKSLIALTRGDLDRAYTLIKQVMIRMDELGHRMGYLWARVRFGYVVLRLGNLSEARGALIEAAREFLNDKFDIGVVFSLEGIAELCIATNKPTVAARLIGWADAMRKQIDDTRPPLEQADVDKIIATCLAKMGEVAFSDAYEVGKKMSLEEAVALALQDVM